MASSRTNAATRWHDPARLLGAVEWVDASLAERALTRSGDVEQPHVYPWATALSVPVGETRIWFKACIPELAYQVAVLELLGRLRPDVVPELLVGDRERGFMLLADAGELGERDDPPRLEHWEEAVALYAQLQLDVAPQVERFVAAGAPDRRGPLFAEQLAEMFEDESILKEPLDAAVTDDELGRLRALLPRLADGAAALDALGVPASIQHDDPHDGNVFVHGRGYRIIDWGDACVANPLFSLSIALDAVAHRFGVDRDSREVARVRDAFLEPWTAVVPRAELLAAIETTLRVAYASVAIKWHEVMRALSVDERKPFVAALPLGLRRLLELCA